VIRRLMSTLAAIATIEATANEMRRDSLTAARKLPNKFGPRILPIMVCMPSPIFPRCRSKPAWMERFTTAVLMTPVSTIIKRKAISIFNAQRLRMVLNTFTLFIFKAVTHTANSFNEFFANLLAQVPDMDIHHA